MERTVLSPSTKIAVTANATSSVLLAAENLRGALVLTNTSATIAVFLGFNSAAEISKGLCLKPLQSFKMDATGCFSGVINVIAESSTALVTGQSFITYN